MTAQSSGQSPTYSFGHASSHSIRFPDRWQRRLGAHTAAAASSAPTCCRQCTRPDSITAARRSSTNVPLEHPRLRAALRQSAQSRRCGDGKPISGARAGLFGQRVIDPAGLPDVRPGRPCGINPALPAGPSRDRRARACRPSTRLPAPAAAKPRGPVEWGMPDPCPRSKP